MLGSAPVYRFAHGDPRRAQRIEGLRDIVQISLGYIQACALDRGGRVWCWGSNYVNSLGVGSSETLVRRPTLVSGVQNVTHVAVYGSGAGTQYARSTDGIVYVWGQYVPTPRVVTIPGVPLDVRSRSSTLCVRLVGGGYACRGVLSPDGRVTGPRPPSEQDPGLISGTQDFIALEGIFDFWCGLRSDRTVSCWGANRVAQLGIAPELSEICQQPCIVTLPPCTETYRCLRTARQVGSMTDVEEIALGGETSCARRHDGSVWCWGGAFTWGDGPDFVTYGDGVMNGELCPATRYTPFTTFKNFDPRPCRRAPVPISGLSGVTALAVGSSHACAVLASGQVWCWGVNRSGQLGDATIINRPTPVPVRF